MKCSTAVPRPVGIPSRTPFIVGAIGLIISGIAALLLLSGSGFSLSSVFSSYNGVRSMVSFSIAGIILGVGLILAGIGYLGIRRNYGLGVGTAGFALSIVTAALFFSIVAIYVITPTIPYPYYPYPHHTSAPWYIVVPLLALSYILCGVMQILWGVAHINSRRYTGNSGLAMATGIILIVSGSLTASLLLSFVGLLLFFVCGILALLVFLMSNVPKQMMQSI